MATSTSALAAMFTIHGLLHLHHNIYMCLTIFFIILLALISVFTGYSAAIDFLDFKYTIFKTSSPAPVTENEDNQTENKQVIAADQV